MATPSAGQVTASSSTIPAATRAGRDPSTGCCGGGRRR